MKFMVSLFRGLALLLLALAGGGCPQEGQNRYSDEQREPHFIEGSRHVKEMDYQAAIESFEKALSVNRNSAAAHWELAVLFESKVPDPAAAIYHYDRFLKLRPNSDNGETARQRILACKQDLARTVSLGPVTEKVQRDLEKLIAENRRLTEENKRLSDQVRTGSLARPPGSTGVTAQPASPAAGSSGGAKPASAPMRSEPLPASIPGATTVRPPGVDGSSHSVPPSGHPAAITAATASRSHLVQPHETLGSIARQYGVRLETLTAANPGVNPRRLRPGQRLNLPP